MNATTYPIAIADEHERLRAYYRVLVATRDRYDRFRRENTTWAPEALTFWNGKHAAVETMCDDLAALFPFVLDEVQS
jgi:hypothetical protein